jgi:hypothetical protein
MHRCEHDAGSHVGEVPAHASAPVASRAWLLVEHPGPWTEQAAETPLPEPLRTLVSEAVRLGIRVQLIRRPGAPGTGAVFLCSTGPGAWLRRLPASSPAALPVSFPASAGVAALERLAAGEQPAAGVPVREPLFLVCTHGRRDQCCGKFGGALARALARRYPVWETTHVGGHMFAGNLVILPHGLYYGPVDLGAASGAIEAYRRGEVTAHRYRGRAGCDAAVQAAEHAELARLGTLPLDGVAVTMP